MSSYHGFKPTDESDHILIGEIQRLRSEVDRLRAALLELHRAISEYDATDADEARLEDAIAEAQRLAPYVPEPASEGF